MTLAERIGNIVAILYPDATFLLSSDFERDYLSYFATDAVLIVLNNQLEDDDSMAENASFNIRERIQISVYIKDEFDTTDKTANDLVEQAKDISRRIYFNIWLLPEVFGNGITHRPAVKVFNSIRSGCFSLANWSYNKVVSCGDLSLELDLSSTTGGTTYPAMGIYQKSFEEIEPIFADPDEGYLFEKWVINGGISLLNPIALVFTKSYKVVAYFIVSGFTTILKSFHNAPVQRGNAHYFGDYSGQDNDVLVKNVRVGTFGASQYISTGIRVIGGVDFIYKGIFKLNRIASQKYVFISGGAASEKGIFILFTSINTLQISISNGTSRQIYTVTSTPLNYGALIDLSVNWNGLIGGKINVNINGEAYSTLATHSWDENSFYNGFIGFASNSLNGNLFYCKIDNYFEYVFNHGKEATISNLLGGIDGTITGAVLATFWGSTSDEAIPYDVTLGATLYKNDSDNTIMPICFNTSQVITGYTRLGWFPPLSGILKGLPNKYNLVGNAEVPTGDYTADEIAAFTNSEIVEVTQNDNAVTQLILKQ